MRFPCSLVWCTSYPLNLQETTGSSCRLPDCGAKVALKQMLRQPHNKGMVREL